MKNRRTARPRRWSFALGSSIAAVAAASSVPARAQCAPDPTVAGGVTDCTVVDADGLRITTNGSTVQVAPSASVTGSGGAAITVDIPRAPATYYETRTATIIVGGRVDGGAQSGIAVLSGASGDYDYYGTKASVTVAAGATVSGSTGITAGPSPDNAYASALVSVTNAGTITGTNGVALRAIDPARGAFDVVENAQGGMIGAIVGTIGTLNNAGVIDGGAISAIDQTSTYNPRPSFGGWTNDGTIRSASAAATIANLSSAIYSLTNSGTIANTGTGAAIDGRYGSNGVAIVNKAGGTISAAGGTAIAASSLSLVNAGTITGDITTQPAYGYFYSTIDSTEGTIVGNVSLGSGDDVVYGRYDGTETLKTGITGTLDAGAGRNALVLAPKTDLTVSTAITLPASFQVLQLRPGEGTTLTLAGGYVQPGLVELGGNGTIVNEAAIATQGRAFATSYPLGGAPSLINKGSIDATDVQYYYAVDMRFGGQLTNSGTITSSGRGVNGEGKTVNSGTIVAADTALYQSGGTVDNSGTIRSTRGIGIELHGNTDNTPAINTGLIEGATYGAVIGYVLNNSGTIAATGSGTAVGLDNYGVLNNLAGGVISGGAYAITGRDSYGSTSVYYGRIFNAGTINGDVSFVSSRNNYGNSQNTYVALAGGVLNGNLTLGQGDTLVTDLVNTGPGQFAGINGTVTTTGGLLRYRVSGEASAVIGAVGPFATTGYELVEGARLTLTAPTTSTLPLVLAGSGTVDLTADITTTNQTALSVVSAAVASNSSTRGIGALKVVNRGALSGTQTDYWGGGFGVVALGRNNVLQNEGTIRAAYTATNGGTSFNAAVVYGNTLVNNGRIELDGSYGTYNVANVVNTGTIEQTGTGASYGIYEANKVTNSGTIVTAGEAIRGFGTAIINSGTIASTGAAAIGYGSFSIDNRAGGTIAGGNGTAIRGNGSIINAGTIIGDVDLRDGYANAYVADGGTLAGNLIMGSGDDVFLQSGDSTGVSGTIDAGAGRNAYGIALRSSGTVAIGAAPATGFQDAMIAAIGADTVATVTGIDAMFTDLRVGGNGTVVNRAALGGRVVTGNMLYPVGGLADEAPPRFVNEGSVTGGVNASLASLVNRGTIGSADLAGAAVTLWNRGALSFENSGLVTTSRADGQPSLFWADTLAISNTGTIDGGLQAYAIVSGNPATGTVSVANSGTIRATAGTDENAAIAVSLASNTFWVRGDARGTIVNAKAGTITASGTGAVAVRAEAVVLDLENNGQIEASGKDALAIQIAGALPATIRNMGTILGEVALGAGDDSLRLLGGTFAGAVHGGEGADVLEIAGGQATFSTVSDVETLRMSAGLATVTGNASFDRMTFTGGRMIGAAGSIITAPAITVGQGATFGSAGTVNGNITVEGTLSPGASPGTMTVNGNIALAGTSVSVFEITPTISDKLIVKGNLSIAPGATLQIEALEPVAPGRSLDLINADSITGKFTNLVRSGSIFGVLAQNGGTISLLGQFANDASFTPQVQGSINYVNDLMVSGRASAAFMAAVPALIANSSTANQAVFARLTPEAYASAGQITVEHGLELADAGRSDAFASRRATPGAFTFASMIGNSRTLDSSAQGTARARLNDYGFIGGIGWGSSAWSIGGFVGYVNSRQTLAALGARTEADAVVAGIHGRWTDGRLGIRATLAYDRSNARTERRLLGGSAEGAYDLTGWTSDIGLTYTIPLNRNWMVQPGLGLTAIRVTRDGAAETGNSPFALQVARERDNAVFVDGALTFKGGMTEDAVTRPYLSIGMRYQVDGRSPFARAALGSGGFDLAAAGAPRAPVLATATLGLDVILSTKLTMFGAVSGEAGNADRRGSVRAGLRLAF